MFGRFPGQMAAVNDYGCLPARPLSKHLSARDLTVSAASVLQQTVWFGLHYVFARLSTTSALVGWAAGWVGQLEQKSPEITGLTSHQKPGWCIIEADAGMIADTV